MDFPKYTTKEHKDDDGVTRFAVVCHYSDTKSAIVDSWSKTDREAAKRAGELARNPEPEHIAAAIAAKHGEQDAPVVVVEECSRVGVELEGEEVVAILIGLLYLQRLKGRRDDCLLFARLDNPDRVPDSFGEIVRRVRGKLYPHDCEHPASGVVENMIHEPSEEGVTTAQIGELLADAPFAALRNDAQNAIEQCEASHEGETNPDRSRDSAVFQWAEATLHSLRAIQEANLQERLQNWLNDQRRKGTGWGEIESHQKKEAD